MTDYISRDALLKELMLDPIGRMLMKRYNLDGFIKAQPAAETGKQGRWVVHILHNDLAFCSECEMLIEAEDAKQFAYCPYCGAKMDGVKE